MPTGIRQYAGEPDTVLVGPSPALWADCPVAEILEDPAAGTYYFDDFVGPFDPTTANGFTLTAVTSGTLSVIDFAGGAIKLDSNGHNADDDGVQIQMTGERWLPAVNTTLWFEARVKFSKVAAACDQFFIGLHVTDTTVIAAGALDESGSLIGFYSDVNTVAANIEFACIKAGSVDIDTSVGAAFADDTWYKLGFKVYTTVAGLLQVDYFVDGVLVGTMTDTADIPVTEMTLTLVSQVEQTATDAELTVDWVRIAQTRAA